MFIQVMQGKMSDANHWRNQVQRWREEIKPGANGYLGSTSGVTPDGRCIAMVRFDSEASAQANSQRREQGEWWTETEKAFDGEVEFYNCHEVDTMNGGGSNKAGFVQIMQGRTKDQEAMRRMFREFEAQLNTARPEMMGMVGGWHNDDGRFTQAIYFTSQEAARKGEATMQDDEERKKFMKLLDGIPTFFDLVKPDLD